MSDMLIPFGGAWLALTPEQYQTALARGRELVAEPVAEQGAHVADEILDAEGMQGRTNIPASWWLEQARKGEIPHLRAGKYVRFELHRTLEHLTSGGLYTDRIAVNRGIDDTKQQDTRHRYRAATDSPSGWNTRQRQSTATLKAAR
jgi:hypothetical protein